VRKPTLDYALEWFGMEVVELVTAVALGAHQTRLLEHLEVLRDGLP